MTFRFYKRHYGTENIILFDKNGVRVEPEKIILDPIFDEFEILDISKDVETLRDRITLNMIWARPEIDENKELYQRLEEAASNLKVVMDELMKKGFSRDEAFELLKYGTFVTFLSVSSGSFSGYNYAV